MAAYLIKSAAVVLFVVALLAETKMGEAQTCSTQLNNLNVCLPYVMAAGGTSTSPSTECCSALQAVQHDCICNTIRISSSLPGLCNLPALTCPN
ncbi:protein MEN-8 [Carica papaya]|uniref:protein MEN-8 n=1 Tax=Carica papaya TaxID=3649 RepID=UPI000B8CB9D0|nr:protein MEN-8 [Carica papaya]